MGSARSFSPGDDSRAIAGAPWRIVVAPGRTPVMNRDSADSAFIQDVPVIGGPCRLDRPALALSDREAIVRGRAMRWAAAMFLVASALAAPACGDAADRIACMQWCEKCGPGPACTANCEARNNPMVANSCSVHYSAKPGQPCIAGSITCQDWCARYRTNAVQEQCLTSNPASCMKKYGGLLACVADRPPNARRMN